VAQGSSIYFKAWALVATAIVLVVLVPGLREVDWVSAAIRVTAIAAGTFSALARRARRSQ